MTLLVTLVVVWNGGMLVSAVRAWQSWDRCMAEQGGGFCIGTAGPILFIMVAVDAVGLIVGLLIAAIVRRVRDLGA